ncbi:RHS repeat-associated core domain-containing protein [Lentzea sp.]|uniref:RHS repeat-associated core domain-containing protein n=1 Tax=Lentzea sp. TaxID=56099 RepID=UPI002ED280C7
MTNPLLAQKQDSTTWHTGINLVDDAAGVYDAVESGGWVEGGISALGAGMDLLTMAMNPVGTLISYGLNWLIEHVKPLQDGLNMLAGDADQIAAYSQTWANVAKAVQEAGKSLADAVAKDTANWTGAAADAYRQHVAGKLNGLSTIVTCANAISTVVKVVGVITGVVRGLVRDMVTQAVGDFIQDALEEVFSLGLGTPFVIAQVVEQVAAWTEKIGATIKKLINSVEKLRPIMSKLEEIWQGVQKVMNALHGRGGSEPHVPHGEGGTHVSSAEPHAGGGGGGETHVSSTGGETHVSSAEPHTGGEPRAGGEPHTGGETHTSGESGTPGEPSGNGRPPGEDSSVRGQTEEPRSTAQEAENRTGCGDPVDVVTGDMFLTQTDVTLPAELGLVLQRTHISSYRVGRLFGRSWSSTVDQRLEVDAQGVCFAGADAIMLVYPTPVVGVAVLPVEGPRWPLTLDADGTYRITRPNGHVLHFTPSGVAGLAPLRAITDRNQHRIDFLADEDGMPFEIRHSGGYRVTVETARGRIVGYRLGDIPLMSFGYNDSGDLTHVTNASGLPHVFDYDTEGRITGWTDRKGTQYRYHFDSSGRVAWAEGTGGILNARFRYEASATTVQDSLGNESVYHLNGLRQIVRTVDPLGNSVTSEWDRYDRLLARTDALGGTTRYEYDSSGRVVAMVLPDGAVKRMAYNELGLSTSVTDGVATTEYSYDDRGNLLAESGPNGVVRTTYDANGHLTSRTDATGATSHITTNAAGLPVVMVDPRGNRHRYERDVFGRLVAVVDPLEGTTRYGWTVDGQPAWRLGPDGGRETWRYDGEGNLVEHVDPGGRRTTFEIGDFDLPAVRVTADGARTAFAYDTEQRVTAVTNAQGRTWTYRYDAVGNLVQEQDFHGRTVSYSYDAASRLVSSTNGAGQTIAYSYDAAGRRVRQVSDDTEITYAYDAQGRLVRAANEAGELVLTRDRAGRVLTESFNGRVLANSYDPSGRRLRRVTPSGTAVDFGYDQLGHLTSVRAGAHALTLDRDRLGRAVAHHLDGHPVVGQSWDPAGRLLAQDVAGHRRQFAWRPDGQLVGEGAKRVDLDVLGRVTAIHTPDNSERYGYDPAGNITAAAWLPGGDTEGQREFDRGLLRAAGRTSFTYDGQGRVSEVRRRTLSGQTLLWRYRWNAFDQLVEVSTPDGQTWRYLYDAVGRRCAKIAGHLRVDFAWDGFDLAEQHVTGTGVTTWVHEPGTFTPVAQLDGAGFHAVVTDQIGRPTALVGTGGRLAWQATFSAWGALLSSRSTTDCPLRFPGQYHDPETGLHYNIFRYYDPRTGRYTSPDPLGLAPSPNPYAYAGNPLLFIDPFGLAVCGRQGPVHLGETDLSKMAYEHRINEGVGSHQNVAVYEYDTPNGKQYLVQANDPGGLHSEQIMQAELQARGIHPDQVTRVYSERVPCSSAGHDCAGIVGQYKNAAITWSLSGTSRENWSAINRWMSQGHP